MNRLSGGEALVRMLEAHGVEIIFGLCGDTSLPLYDALHRLDHGITHVLTRDERSAAYMADCYARVSGRVGVCEGPSGGGATYILPGLVEANESSVPVLGITTDIGVAARGRYTLTELDQDALFRPLTKWNRVLDRGDEIPKVVRAAFRAMTTGRPGAAHIGLPYDVQKEPVDEDDVWGDAELGRYPARRAAPDPDAVAAAAEALLAAERPLFICGGGVIISGGEAELVALAESLGAAVAYSVSGHGCIPDGHPLCIGHCSGKLAAALLREADALLAIGCRFTQIDTSNWTLSPPSPHIQFDPDPAEIGREFPVDIGVVGNYALVRIRSNVEGSFVDDQSLAALIDNSSRRPMPSS